MEICSSLRKEKLRDTELRRQVQSGDESPPTNALPKLFRQAYTRGLSVKRKTEITSVGDAK
jgi:hypothetical protein